MSGTFWALIPPLVAIALALLTKEVYLSLMVGIFAGGLFFTGFQPLAAAETVFSIMGEKIGGNVNILIFLTLLGILVALITRSGASRAYGEWASGKIHTKRGAQLATAALGALIFVDDYFNCLTVGTVMGPVADRYRISRAKLAYVIDATAAPVCILAPISSWAAAVGSSLPENSTIDGFSLFLQTIPINFYALFTLLFLVVLIWLNFDFSAMEQYNLSHGTEDLDLSNDARDEIQGNGKVKDLVLPIACLIVLCIGAMLYTGGILEGKSIVQAFADCDSASSLVLGSFFTLVFTFILYLPRKVITFSQFTESFVMGLQSMASAIMILSLAWTLSGICSKDYLNLGGYVSMLVSGNVQVQALMPAIFFLVAAGLAFATGTSWGTFGILIPIAVAVFSPESSYLVLSVAAILAGAVCGDHISPISDTTILASAGANCHHIDHVSTQIPYALLVAGCSFISYLLLGITQSSLLAFLVGVCLMLGIVWFLYRRQRANS